MADEKEVNGPKDAAGKKSKKAHSALSEQFQKELFAFIEQYKKSGKSVNNHDEIIKLFLNKTRKQNTNLYQQYGEYVAQISNCKNIEEVTFADLEELPIIQDGRLSELLADRQSKNFEADKQETVFSVRKDHYTASITAQDDKQLSQKRDALCKARFGKENLPKLIKSTKLLPTLQKLFDELFKEHCTEEQQKGIGTYLSDPDKRPTVKTYLDAFGVAGKEIKDKNVRDSLMKDQRIEGKKVKGALSLGKSIAQLTQVSLLAEGILIHDNKQALINTFDNTFSHHEITKGVFSGLPRSQYLTEKNPHAVFSKLYQVKIEKANSESEANQRRALYEKELLKGYLDRANDHLKKQTKKTPKAKLLEQLTTISKLSATEFPEQIKELTTTVSAYLQEDFLKNLMEDSSLILAQFEQFGIHESHFPAYLNFWKQIYDLDSNTATLNLGKGKEFTLYADKKLLTHPNKFRSIDDLNKLFSFEWTIDFEKSDDIFSKLFGNTPRGYIVDDRTGKIIDTIDYTYDLPVYLDEPTLKNRLILDKKSKITVTITDNETKTTFEGYPSLADDEEAIQLFNDDGKLLTTIPFNKSNKEDSGVGIIDTTKYTIQAHTRTFKQPATPPVITQLIQAAVFNKMVPEGNKTPIPIRNIVEQSDMLDSATPVRPYFDAYAEEEEYAGEEKIDDLEKEVKRFTSYRFASTQEIPEGILKETARRFSDKKPEDLHQEVKAWIDQGEIFFHKEYFCKTHNLQDISHEAGILTFTLENGKKVTINKIAELKTHQNILDCIADLKSAKVHEIAHRLFEFHYIQTITHTSNTGEIDIDQETLCEIADGKSLPRKYELQPDGTKRRFVMLEKNKIQHKVWLDKLEEQLGEKIEGFSRKGVKSIDAAHLDEYQQNYNTFADLLTANTANTTTPTPPPTVQTVTTGRQAMTNRLNRFIELIDENFDPTNQQLVEQRATAQQHLDTLNQQQTTLQAGSPTQDELDSMHQQHVDTAQFLQQHAPTPPQPTNNTRTQNARTTTPATTTSTPTENSTTTPQENGGQNTPTQDSPSPEEETNAGYSELEKNKFDEGFASFKGDISAPLEKGTAIFLKENISEIPGRGFNRVKYTIVGLTDETISFEMSDASEKVVRKKSIIELPRTDQSLQRLKKVGKGEVYKYGKAVATKSGCMSSMKQTLGKRADTDNFKKTISDNNSTKKEDITHIGLLKEKIVGSDRTESIIYKVDWGVNYVTLSSAIPDGDKNDQEKKALRTKKMDYDTFQMFCFTKDLNPLTSTEVTRSRNRLNPDDAVRDGMPAQGISLAAIRKGLKAIPETYKKKFEEEQEFQAALATDYFSNRLPNTSFLYLDEVKNDLSGVDGVIWNRIQKYKSERAATGESGDKASIHDIPIAQNIKANIFENIKDTRKYKYRAAGALLFALEKGGPYFRGLAPYANKDGGGRWVKCILGEEARKEFVIERQRKIDQFKSSSGSPEDNEKLNSEIVKLELQFIENGTKDKPGRGTKFGRQVEEHKDTLYGGAQSLDPGSFTKKGDFAYMYDAFWGGGVGQNLPWVLMSSLEAMKSAVEEGADYNTFYMCVMMIFATGMVHMLPKDYIDKLKGIGRSRGIPITLLAGDKHASGKAMRILDHIARNAGIKTFTEFSGHQLDMFDAIHIHNYESNRNSIRNSFANRWANHGRTVMNAFNYKNDFLIDIPHENDPSLTGEQKKNAKVATDYLGGDGVFNGYKAVQDNDSVSSIDGQSPFFQEGILNLSEGSFRSYMMQFNQGQLTNEHSASMWSNFAGILEQFETNVNSSSNEKANHVMTKLLYEKFIRFFDRELGGTAGITEPEERRGTSYKDLFKAAIRGEVSLDKLVRKSVFKEKDRVDNRSGEEYITHETISNGMVKDTILQFASLVKKSYENLTDPANKADIFGT